MTPHFILLDATSDFANGTFTLRIGVVDADAAPIPYQVDGQGQPVRNGLGLLVAIEPPPSGAVLFEIVESDRIGTTADVVLASLRAKVQQPLADYEAFQSLVALKTAWSGVLVPVAV